MSLKNGCVCCTLNDDLIASIVDFCSENPPDAFMVEASGISDPRALDQSILALQTAGHVVLNNRIYVLDADQFGSLDYADTELVIDHAAASNLVVINKVDLADAGKLEMTRDTLTRSTGRTLIREARHGALPLNALFLPDGRFALGLKISADALHQTGDHQDDYWSWSRSERRMLKREPLLDFLGEISKFALRAKGHVFLEEEPSKHLMSSVGVSLLNRSGIPMPPVCRSSL